MRQCWDVDDLVEWWTLGPGDRELVANKTGATRLGFAVLLKFFEMEARFPRAADEIPIEVVDFVARQIDVPFDVIGSYDWSGRSWKRHRAQIREHFGFRAWSATRDTVSGVAAVIERSTSEGENRAQMALAVTAWCRTGCIEPPVPGQMDRLIGAAVAQWEAEAFKAVNQRIPAVVGSALENLLTADQRDVFTRLRTDAGAVGVDTVFDELDKLVELRRLGVDRDVFEGLPDRVIGQWADRFAGAPPSALSKMSPSTQRTLTAAWAYRRERQVVDGIVDLLIAVVHKIGARAERRVEREELADLKRVRGKTRLLFRLAEAALANPEGTVSEVSFPIINEETLQDLVREHHSSDSAVRTKAKIYLRASYSRHYRRIVPKLLASLTFRSNNTAHRPVLDGVELIKEFVGRNERTFPADVDVPLDGVVPLAWRDLVVTVDFDGEERVNRISYEICLLQALREQLRCKEIWVEGAYRWRNPDDDLPADFDTRRPEFYLNLNKPMDAGQFVDGIHADLSSGLDQLASGPRSRSALGGTPRKRVRSRRIRSTDPSHRHPVWPKARPQVR